MARPRKSREEFHGTRRGPGGIQSAGLADRQPVRPIPERPVRGLQAEQRGQDALAVLVRFRAVLPLVGRSPVVGHRDAHRPGLIVHQYDELRARPTALAADVRQRVTGVKS